MLVEYGMGKRIWRKFLFLFNRRRFDEELSEEMRLHMELRAEKLRSASAASKRFGNRTLALESSRDVWTCRWLEEVRQDLRFAARLLRRKLGFTAIAAVTLALGIGATTAVFSIVEAVLLRPLPYRDPGRLVVIWDHGLREKGLAKIFARYDDYKDWRRTARSFENIAAATWAYNPSRILTGRGAAKEVMAIPATASFFETLGVPAMFGRTFTEDDDGRGCAVVLSHAFWTSALGGDATIIGQPLTLDRQSCRVVGVMPATFSFYPPETQIWILLGKDDLPPSAGVAIFARLKPGVTREQAQAELLALYRAANPSGFWHDFEPRVYDLHGEFTFLASRTLRLTLIVAFCSVLLVLAIAALNVANLLLARLAERQRELAVRAALGSGRARLVRQVLTESLLLALIGTLGGIALAFAAVRYFRHAGPIILTVGADVRIDPPVLLFTILVALATTLAFGLLPALSISRTDIFDRLKAAGRGAVGGALRRRAAGTMVALEMGLSFILLMGAGLLLASALHMGNEPLGFNPDRLFETHTMLPVPRYQDAARREQFYDALLDRLRETPGVAGAALTDNLPPYVAANDALEIQGHPVAAGSERHDIALLAVGSAFFRVLEAPLLEGRSFEQTDGLHSAPVAIVNEALAHEYFRGVNPLGKQIRVERPSGQEMPWMTVVGIVGNLKHSELMNEMTWVGTPAIYQPLLQSAPQRFEIAIRAEATTASFEHRIQEQIAAVDASVPINPVEPVNAEISKTLAYPRFRAMVLGFFSLAALLLSAVGLNGVLSQIVAQRVPEFGIRKAMGAEQRDLLLLVARQGGVPVALGMAGGIGCAVLFSWLLRALLYGVNAADPKVIALVAALFLGIAALAIALPARRAALVDPMVALRDE
jgi:putative ABC transport system permease protein